MTRNGGKKKGKKKKLIIGGVILVVAALIAVNLMRSSEPTTKVVTAKVKQGKLVSVPYSILLNDAFVFRAPYDADTFVDMCKRQFDVLYAEGAQSGRVMSMALHPYVMGQPHRIKQLDELLGYIGSHEGVWHTTADDIAEFYIASYYDQALAHAAQLGAKTRGA